MNSVGSILGESDDQDPTTAAVAFLRAVNGAGMKLLDREAAIALFDKLSSNGLPLTGRPDDSGGFCWTVPGSRPRRTHVVRPVALPLPPVWPDVLRIVIKLLFPAVDGERLERSFHADFVSPFDAYNAACCMWSTRDTGYGAIAAVLVDEATGWEYPVDQMAKTCGAYPTAAMQNLAKTGTDNLVPVPSQTGAPAGEDDRPPAVPAWGAAPRGRGAPPVSDPRRDRRSEGIGDAPRPPAHPAGWMSVPGGA